MRVSVDFISKLLWLKSNSRYDFQTDYIITLEDSV